VPFSYEIDPEAAITLVVGDGAVTHAERLSAVRAWLTDPRNCPGMSLLCDFSAATTVPTLEEIQEIVGVFLRRPQTGSPRRIAIVSSRPATFGVARQFQGLLDDAFEMKGFADRDTAREWLQG
jgi:hypothetical protein